MTLPYQWHGPWRITANAHLYKTSEFNEKMVALCRFEPLGSPGFAPYKSKRCPKCVALGFAGKITDTWGNLRHQPEPVPQLATEETSG